jgi:hypothetical protein
VREAKLETEFRNVILAIGLIAIVFLSTTIFLYWKFTEGAIGHWFAPVIIVNALLNSGIVLYFAVLRYRKAHAQSLK